MLGKLLILSLWILMLINCGGEAGDATERVNQTNTATPDNYADELRQWLIDNKGKFPGSLFKDCSECPEMLVIPGGIFQMGSEKGGNNEKPVHSVTVKSFAMGKYEVMVAEFRQFVQATGYKTEAEKAGGCSTWAVGWDKQADKNWQNPGLHQTDKFPVVCVSWNDATAYAQWLSQKTGKFYRLPTEAEWEYAARAGTQTDYYWGNEDNQVCQYANVGDETAKAQFGWTRTVECADGYAFTAPVGSYKPNAFGLYDMAGNVWEWTCSAYTDKYDGNELVCATGGECCVAVIGTTIPAAAALLPAVGST